MKQSEEQVKNPQLVVAMQEVIKNENSNTMSKMAAALMDSRLLTPIEQQTVLTEKTGPGTRIRFEEIKNVQGDKYYLAFTDMAEYDKWNQDGKNERALIMTMEDFGNILIRQINDMKGFVINPFGENISISKDLLLSLLKQREAKMNANRGS